jgi:hypothetical protein
VLGYKTKGDGGVERDNRFYESALTEQISPFGRMQKSRDQNPQAAHSEIYQIHKYHYKSRNQNQN